MRRSQPWRWTDLRGYASRAAPSSLPSEIGTAATDVRLEAGTLGRRRLSLSSVSLTSGPSATIHYLAAYRPSGTHLLFAFSDLSTMAVHSWDTATWTSRTLYDAAQVNPAVPCAVTFNNKLFLGYNTAVNRLQVWDGTSFRRVGLSTPSAPTVANTGAGAYANTARYYRIQFLIKSGSDVIAMSELSTAVSFTPSGAGTAARITKSTTVDSATHWRIYGLIGTSGDTYDLYEQVGSDTAVGTTTLDDSTNPSAYSGDAPPAFGINIPPPSAKYLLTDGNRLIMAGAWETTGGAGETVPKNSRVWFTRVLGSSDLGDDESIPDTEDQSNWIDVGENDGDAINGLGGPIDGIVYVFKSHAIYQLIPTAIDTLPYRAELISHEIGLMPAYETSHRTIIEIGGRIYFQAWSGLWRLHPATGLEYLGWDISNVNELAPDSIGATFDETSRAVVLVRASGAILDVFAPEFARATDAGMRGGWTQWIPTAFNTPKCLVTFELDGGVNFRYVFLGGAHSGAAQLHAFSSQTASDAGGTFTPSITSHAHGLDDGASNISVENPVIEATVQSAAATVPSLSYVLDYGRETRGPVTAPSLVAVGSATRAAVPVGGLHGSDAQVVQVTVTWHASQTGVIDAVVVPIHPQERR